MSKYFWMGQGASRAEPSLTDMLARSARATHDMFIDSMMKPWRDTACYRWSVTRSEKTFGDSVEGYEVMRIDAWWAPPEKVAEPASGKWGITLYGSGMYDASPPQGMDSDNHTIRYETTDFEGSTKRHADLPAAEAYIKHNVRLRNDPKANAVADFLDGLPCGCGEYGTVSRTEYLEHARELIVLVEG